MGVGFQHMSREAREAIQRKGGAAGGHRFVKGDESTRAAAAKGGRMGSTDAKAAAGRKGGLAKARRRKEQE